MIVAEIVLALLALFGHFVLWIGLNNRLHAMPIKRPILKALSALCHLGTLATPVAFAWWVFSERPSGVDWYWLAERDPIAFFYVTLCVGVALMHIPRWLHMRFSTLATAWRYGSELSVLDLQKRLGRWPGRGFKFAVGRRVPFNQVMQVRFMEKRVPLGRLPHALEGLRVAHLSDLHFSGRVEPAFFHEVVREVNSLAPDLILITGDICDTVECVPWIAEILSPLRAPNGKFFILGNHDDRLKDVPALRRAIEASGCIDLGGTSRRVSIRGEEILLAGNEVPWFGRPAVVEKGSDDFSILLSHSPDQLAWAKRNHFDLMLSGHTHGGQIQFPVIGPVVCPSWYGLRYSSGLFLEQPTVVHVTRGISGLFPIRWNCRPEVAILVLERGNL